MNCPGRDGRPARRRRLERSVQVSAVSCVARGDAERRGRQRPRARLLSCGCRCHRRRGAGAGSTAGARSAPARSAHQLVAERRVGLALPRRQAPSNPVARTTVERARVEVPAVRREEPRPADRPRPRRSSRSSSARARARMSRARRCRGGRRRRCRPRRPRGRACSPASKRTLPRAAGEQRQRCASSPAKNGTAGEDRLKRVRHRLAPSPSRGSPRPPR